MKITIVLMLAALFMLLSLPGCVTSKERRNFEQLVALTQEVEARLVAWGQHVKNTQPPEDSKARVAAAHNAYLTAVDVYYMNVTPGDDYENYAEHHDAVMRTGRELLHVISEEMKQ